MPDGMSAERGPPSGMNPKGDEMPPRMLAVAEECIHGGLDRQGRGRSQWPGLPRDEARFPITTTGPQPPKRHPSH